MKREILKGLGWILLGVMTSELVNTAIVYYRKESPIAQEIVKSHSELYFDRQETEVYHKTIIPNLMKKENGNGNKYPWQDKI